VIPTRFDDLLQEFRELEDKLLNYKRGEYATSTDRLENFRSVAEMAGCTMSEVALIYLLKHIQSIATQVKSKNFDWKMTTEAGTEGLKQRFVDAVNYLHLLAACIEEEKWGPCKSGLTADSIEPKCLSVELDNEFRQQMKERGVELP